MRDISEEEDDILQRSNKRSKEDHHTMDSPMAETGGQDPAKGSSGKSYSDTVKGASSSGHGMTEEADDEGNTSGDDTWC